ncbi:MFS transporter [Azospirillum sp. TSH100]|uniref:MFS transporter n=1 Tax=Azospirillum sp. TSH100 TaxID=652764 RepID=UPI000D65523C|nr:MFS transporter [Azospirillum sp. TSH100]
MTTGTATGTSAQALGAAGAKAPAKEFNLTRMLIATSIGNALEWYDIAVYGFFALYITKAFFPAANETVGLLLAFGTFAISYLARPLGALVLGNYADRVGRKAAMLACILLMVLGTAMITFMPGYASIGILAPIGILVARLIQGFSAGGEFGSATAFLVEHAPDRRGYIASWQFASQGISSALAALFGVLLTAWMPADQLQDWGWRLPFAFGLLVGPVGLYIRRHLDEPEPTEENHPQDGERAAVATVFASQKLRLVVAIGCLIISTAVNYLLVYMPTYAVKQLGLTPTVGYASTFAGAIILTVLTPYVGHMSDRLGRTRAMLIATVLMFASFFPCFLLLNATPTATIIIAVVMWLATLKSVYFGALPALMSDLFPRATRATGLSFSYNLGVTLFGGLGPFAMTWLTDATGSKLSPSYYLMVLATLSFVSLIAARRRFGIS